MFTTPRISKSAPGSRPRLWLRIVIVLLAAALLIIALIYFKQHALIYHPRPYDASYAQALPSNGEEISYPLSFEKQTAFYIPAREGVFPNRLWVAFCGNGSLALDWTTILDGYPNATDAFLLIDNRAMVNVPATLPSPACALLSTRR